MCIRDRACSDALHNLAKQLAQQHGADAGENHGVERTRAAQMHHLIDSARPVDNAHGLSLIHI